MRRRALGRAAPAFLLALTLSAAWAVGDWARVGQMSLPDTDDMMRLVQIRDLLAGQAWSDLTQHRLNGGLAMHWTRLADLGPLAVIAALRPAIGQPTAELVAILLWPMLLFAGFLFLAGEIAARLAGSTARLPGTILAALAYPAISLFSPGRIDHHNLQILLVLAAVYAMIGRADARSGAMVGLAAAVGLAIGLETGPQLAALLALSVLLWVRDPTAEATRLGIAGLALLGGTGAMLLAFRPAVFPADLCDAFTPGTALAAALAGSALALLAGIRPANSRGRLAAAAIAGLVVVGITIAAFPACMTGPYGAVDPRLMRLWMANVAEARGVFADPLVVILPNVGLIAVGLVAAALWYVWRPESRSRLVAPMLVLAVSAAIAVIQLRGVYIGSAVAPALVAAAIAEARTRGSTGLTIPLWIAGSGIIWLTGAALIDRSSEMARTAASSTARDCRSAAALAPLAGLPPGRLMAPIDLGPYSLAHTRHSIVAASYHRNNDGNAAMYDFFLARPEVAATIASRLDVTYVALCDGDFAELDVDDAYPESVAPARRRAATRSGAGLSIWRVRLARPDAAD